MWKIARILSTRERVYCVPFDLSILSWSKATMQVFNFNFFYSWNDDMVNPQVLSSFSSPCKKPQTKWLILSLYLINSVSSSSNNSSENKWFVQIGRSFVAVSWSRGVCLHLHQKLPCLRPSEPALRLNSRQDGFRKVRHEAVCDQVPRQNSADIYWVYGSF